jgi:hypothetical protein
MFYILVILATIFAMPAKADETAIVGTWQVTSFSLEYQGTKEVVPFSQPTGYLQYSPRGHMATFLSDELPTTKSVSVRRSQYVSCAADSAAAALPIACSAP